MTRPRLCARCGAPLTNRTRYDGARTTCATLACPASRTTQWRKRKEGQAWLAKMFSPKGRVAHTDSAGHAPSYLTAA